MRDYMANFMAVSDRIGTAATPRDWEEIYVDLTPGTPAVDLSKREAEVASVSPSSSACRIWRGRRAGSSAKSTTAPPG